MGPDIIIVTSGRGKHGVITKANNVQTCEFLVVLYDYCCTVVPV